jgi:hypothetical protein
MYKASSQPGTGPGAQQGGPSGDGAGTKSGGDKPEDVVDAEFVDVDDKK